MNGNRLNRVLIYGFFGVVGSIWAVGLTRMVYDHLVNAWSGSRFWESANEMGLYFPMLGALAMMGTGVIGMLYELFRKKG